MPTPTPACRRADRRSTSSSTAAIGDEMLWVGSMPCGPAGRRERSPSACYGTSQRRHAPRASTAWAWGTATAGACRPSPGIHYNWSLPGCISEQYFGLIRNFRRHSFLLLYLFGASPAFVPQLRRRARARTAAAGAGGTLPCRTPPRCAWGAWATRATRAGGAGGELQQPLRRLRRVAAEALTRPTRLRAIGIRNPVANTTSWPPACCRSRTSSTARSAPNA